MSLEFTFLGALAGFGWLLTMYCIYDKYDRKKDNWFHAAKDVLNETFAKVTLIAAVTIAINLTFRLPDFTNELSKWIEVKAPEINPEKIGRNIKIPPIDNSDIDNKLADILDLLNPEERASQFSLSTAILQLDKQDKLGERSFQELLTQLFDGASVRDGSLYFAIEGDENERTFGIIYDGYYGNGVRGRVID